MQTPGRGGEDGWQDRWRCGSGSVRRGRGARSVTAAPWIGAGSVGDFGRGSVAAATAPWIGSGAMDRDGDGD